MLDAELPVLPDAQLLDRHNWQDWKVRVETICRMYKHHQHLDGTHARPTDPPPGHTLTAAESQALVDSQAAWDDDNELCKAIVILNMRDISGSGVQIKGRTAHEVWSQLVHLRERRDTLTVANAEKYLEACLWWTGNDEHFTEMRRRQVK
ncbi:hypothetical protein AcW1_005349 [Taiwanofungus camphoratus]|nr:hypothetical protein AcW1_005349 [Antrodia cinnamomea]